MLTAKLSQHRSLIVNNELSVSAITDAEGLSRLEYLDAIQAPNRKISAQKIYNSGYRVAHADPNAALVQARLREEA